MLNEPELRYRQQRRPVFLCGDMQSIPIAMHYLNKILIIKIVENIITRIGAIPAVQDK